MGLQSSLVTKQQITTILIAYEVDTTCIVYIIDFFKKMALTGKDITPNSIFFNSKFIAFSVIADELTCNHS